MVRPGSDLRREFCKRGVHRAVGADVNAGGTREFRIGAAVCLCAKCQSRRPDQGGGKGTEGGVNGGGTVGRDGGTVR